MVNAMLLNIQEYSIQESYWRWHASLVESTCRVS